MGFVEYNPKKKLYNSTIKKRNWSSRSHIFYFQILRMLRKQLIYRGKNPLIFMQKLTFLLKYDSHLNIPISFFLTHSFSILTPFLIIYKAKIHKKSKRRIDKVRYISQITGIRLVIFWIFNLYKESRDFDTFITNFYFEICDAFFTNGLTLKKKLDHYQKCLNTRLQR